MSKQSQAKDEQGYRMTPSTCSNCAHYTSDAVTLPSSFSWTQPRTVEKNIRCGIGKFAIKKTGVCNLHKMVTT